MNFLNFNAEVPFFRGIFIMF